MQVTFVNDPDAAYERYMHDGFFIEPDVLTPQECERVIEEAEKLPNALDGAYIPMMNPHLSSPLFADIMSHPRIVSVMRRLIHGIPCGLQSKIFYMPSQRAGFGVHQDNYFVEAKADAFASAWLALVDVNKHNGGLYGYVGSHHQGLLPVKPMNVQGRDKRETMYEETVVPEGWVRQDLTVKRGSVLFLHAYNVHGSYPNLSDKKRYVILNTYIRQGEAFRSGDTAHRQECRLEMAS